MPTVSHTCIPLIADFFVFLFVVKILRCLFPPPPLSPSGENYILTLKVGGCIKWSFPHMSKYSCILLWVRMCRYGLQPKLDLWDEIFPLNLSFEVYPYMANRGKLAKFTKCPYLSHLTLNQENKDNMAILYFLHDPLYECRCPYFLDS